MQDVAESPESDNVTYESIDEKRLVERGQKGDREAIDELVRRYQNKAYQYAYRLTHDADEAADLAAEAFVRIYTAIPRFRAESRFTTWLYRIITNCFLDQKKKEKPRKTVSLDENPLLGESGTQMGAPVGDPTESSEKNERGEILMAAIDELPEYQRAMIVMYHMEMLGYEEIAAALDLPIGTVKSRLNRARLALRELLADQVELFISG